MRVIGVMFVLKKGYLTEPSPRFSTLNLIFPRVQKKKIGNGKAG